MNIEDMLERSGAEIISKESFLAKISSQRKLRIKMGFDPTNPDLHLGHAVGLRILRALQDQGHTIIFIIGDYTTKVGDPSGRNTTRPILTDVEIDANAKTYFDQVGKILDVKKAEIQKNSTWLSKITLAELIDLLGKFTVAQIIERDDFQKRLKEGIDVGLHEMLYPVMQAYDSVQVKADVEFGGTDQKFNLLAGRDLQKKMGQTPQEIVMVKLLVGLDGKHKMSKSLNNYIALTDSPSDMYGKVMSIPDELILDYFALCTDVNTESLKVIEAELKSNARNPRDVKAELAKLITENYHNAEAAEEAEEEFRRVVVEKQIPENIEEISLKEESLPIAELVIASKLAASKSEAYRLIEQGGLSVDEVVITDSRREIAIKSGMILRAGKRRYIKIK